MRLIAKALLLTASFSSVLVGGDVANGSDKLDPNNTYAVIVGVLSWQQGSLTTYSPDHRQDVALHERLKALGVPEKNMRLLLDKAATRSAIEKSIAATTKKAGEDSTLIIYYAGHGLKHDGEGIFACYDIRTKAMQQTGWRHSSLAGTIKQNFRGDRVLLFADCCFSGTLAAVAEELSEKGLSAASLTSASPYNTSTNNWTFTISLVEALGGQPLADANRDGVITISEAAGDVQQAMGHYEGQRSGFALHNLPPDFELTSVQAGGVADTTGQQEFGEFQRGQYVSARHEGKWRVARVLEGRKFGAAPDELRVQFQAYHERPKMWVLATDVRAAEKPKLRNEPPDPLPAEEAKQKASLDGHFTELLAKIEVDSDFRNYGAFHDYGEWAETSYAGHTDLPLGYWVYVYPHWYIWKTVPMEQPPVAPVPIMVLQVAPQAKQHKAILPYDPLQMCGEPDTPEPGDASTAWVARSADARKAWIELDYSVPIQPAAVHVYENYTPGAVYRVSGVDEGEEKLLFSGVDPTPKEAPSGISKIPLNTDKTFSRIRIYLNCKAVSGWNEIDAVGLVDPQQNVHWAVDARASSTYGQQSMVEFFDRFQSEEERVAERIAELNAEIQQRKAKIRSLNQSLEKEHTVIDKLYEQLNKIKKRSAKRRAAAARRLEPTSSVSRNPADQPI